MTFSHSLKGNFDYMRNKIQKSILFNQQVLHFINNLHNFLALEVLETQYKKIIDILPKVSNLNELIDYHEKFVENIIRQCLLNEENSNILKKILNIFNIIINFRTALDVLIRTSLEEQFNNYYTTESNEEDENNKSDNLNKRFSNEAFIQISNYYEQFKDEVYNLIISIQSSNQNYLKYLAMKLDYNYYYSLREMEKENKKQQDIIYKLNFEYEKRKREQMELLNNENDDFENEEEEDENYKNFNANHINYEEINTTPNINTNYLNNDIQSRRVFTKSNNNNHNINFTNDIEMNGNNKSDSDNDDL
jgi:hypothetical protein